MKIALVGYGKMGKIIEQAAHNEGHEISAIVDPYAEERGISIYKKIEDADLSNTDAAIEFSMPNAAVANIIELAKRKIPVVVGTTAWQNVPGNLDKVQKIIEEEGTSLLWATNFSIGVNLFNRIAWYAAELFNKFPAYDAGGFEAHHNKKLDSPSGTAKTLAEGTLERLDRKEKIVYETLKDRNPKENELHYPSLRLGNIPGTHSLFFDSAADTIEITHTARNREGFALGAVKAAEWLVRGGTSAEKRQGIFTIDEMLKDILNLYN